jgi:hypothetical protein
MNKTTIGIAAATFAVSFGASTTVLPAATAVTTLVPGLTKAPDALSATFRDGAGAEHAAVDVTWDAVAVADSGGSGSAELITLDGEGVPCLTPATGSATPSGGTSAGGNNTTKWTLSCGPIGGGAYAGQRPSTHNIARLVIMADCAKDTTDTYFNSLEQVNIAVHGLTRNLPDLIGVEFFTNVKDASNNTVDKAVFTFSKTIESLNAAGSLGVVPITGGGDATIADSSGPFPGDGPLVEGATIRVFFPAGTLTQAVRGYADFEAVTAAGSGLKNQPGATGGGNGFVAGPQIGKPVLKIRRAAMTSTSVPAVLSWTATDSHNTIKQFQISRSVDGAAAKAFRAVGGKVRSLDVTVHPKHSYVFTVHAVDASGMDAAKKSAAVTPAVVNDGAAVFSSGWRRLSLTYALGGSLRYTSTKGASMRFTFTGREVALVAATGPHYAGATLTIDGSTKSFPVSMYAGSPHLRRIVWEHRWSTTGQHHVKLVVPRLASGKRVDVDGFVVTR